MGSYAPTGQTDAVGRDGTRRVLTPQGDGALHPPGPAPTRRRSAQEVDRLRARALCGDGLAELSDAEREWVWRSLLKGVRMEQALALAQMASDEVEPALERVRRWYAQRLDAYTVPLRVRTPVPARPRSGARAPRRGW